jgi:hypothetical protein
MSALHDAARSSNPDDVAAILAQGLVDIDGRDRLSRTPLIIAAWAGQARNLPPICCSTPTLQLEYQAEIYETQAKCAWSSTGTFGLCMQLQLPILTSIPGDCRSVAVVSAF